MDTHWGLDLDMSAVRLMRREGDAWIEQAIEKIDSPDIEQRLEKLIAPIENGGPVMLFLPREQILYTHVEIDASAEPEKQIFRAMEGRTPYALDELSIDWDLADDGGVLVAAIARDTLDEAAAFAEVRALKIAGYSTLFSGEDFPRLPVFDGPDLVDEPQEPAKPVTFVTARVPSRPPDASVAAAAVAATAKARFTPTATSSDKPAPPPRRTVSPEKTKIDDKTPVLLVDDATPVVKVKPPSIPLDPGIPIAAPNAPPRVRTDIAAASVSGHAASLTPPGSSVRMRKARAPISTLAVFAVAFLLTIGVAVLVWNMLPMRPSSTADAPVDTGALPPSTIAEQDGPIRSVDPAEEDTAALDTEPQVAEETVEETATAPLEAAVVAPLSEIGTAALQPPTPDLVPALEAQDLPEQLASLTPPDLATPGVGVLPEADRSTPELPLPKMTAEVQTQSPFLGPDPDTEANSDGIYVSAFEVPDPAGDAIALPASRQFSADALPDVPGAELAALDGDPARDPVASAVEQALADALAGPGGLIPTDLARNLPETAPRARPDQFTEEIERQQFGGRTRDELASLRPPARPASAQSLATSDPEAAPSDLAVETAFAPRNRPENMATLVSVARAQQEAARVSASASLSTPDTSSAVVAALEDDSEPENRAAAPRTLNIPTTASVARQATIPDAIRLNRINLVGVYGAPSDRRALVRLSSGRYVKVKVGDRVDGGTVAQITDSELYYRKGNRTLSLQVPQG